MNAELAGAVGHLRFFLMKNGLHSEGCNCPACTEHPLRKSFPMIVAALEATGSDITEGLVATLRSRDAHGKKKYGTSLDRTDLTPDAWGQHMLEELLDAAGYLQALRREIAKGPPCAE